MIFFSFFTELSLETLENDLIFPRLWANSLKKTLYVVFSDFSPFKPFKNKISKYSSKFQEKFNCQKLGSILNSGNLLIYCDLYFLSIE